MDTNNNSSKILNKMHNNNTNNNNNNNIIEMILTKKLSKEKLYLHLNTCKNFFSIRSKMIALNYEEKYFIIKILF